VHSWSTFGAKIHHGQFWLTKFTTAQIWGNHHLLPYSILYASPRNPHPNDMLFQDSQVGVPKLPKLGFSQLWGPITSHVDLGLRWGLKKSCSPCRELFQGYVACCLNTSKLGQFPTFNVGSQIANLTFDLSFGHNLCFKCPNGSCEPILDIYVSIAFQWYK